MLSDVIILMMRDSLSILSAIFIFSCDKYYLLNIF